MTDATNDPKCINAPSDLSESPLFCLHKAINKATGISKEFLKDSGVNFREAWVMVVVSSMPDVNQRQIADLLDINHNVMVTMVDRLESLLLVVRQKHPDNRRQYSVVLTEKGQQWVREWHKSFKSKVRDMFRPLNSKEIHDYLLH